MARSTGRKVSRLNSERHENMNCPACENSLHDLNLHQVKVAVCSQCQGVWFDKQALKEVVDQIIAKENIATTETQFLFQSREIFKPNEQEGLRACPQCDMIMKKLNYAYDSNVFIDKCGQCEGVWTDKGELEAIAEHTKHDPRIAQIGRELVGPDEELKKLHWILDGLWLIARIVT